MGLSPRRGVLHFFFRGVGGILAPPHIGGGRNANGGGDPTNLFPPGVWPGKKGGALCGARCIPFKLKFFFRLPKLAYTKRMGPYVNSEPPPSKPFLCFSPGDLQPLGIFFERPKRFGEKFFGRVHLRDSHSDGLAPVPPRLEREGDARGLKSCAPSAGVRLCSRRRKIRAAIQVPRAKVESEMRG